MTAVEAEPVARTAVLAPTWLVHGPARDAWEALRAVLDDVGPVPCEVSGDPDAWWSDGSPDGLESQLYAARACRFCPAAGACLSYAIAADERFGVWGGRTPAQRRGAPRV